MPPGTFVLLTIAFLVAVAPYGLLFLAAGRDRVRASAGESALLLLLVGLAGFSSIGALACWIGLRFLLWLHLGLSLLGLVFLPGAWKRSHATGPAAHGSRALLVLVLAAVLVRLVPILLAGDTVGGADAGFHAILANKILVDGRLTTSWAPVSTAPVIYPRAVHVLCAFMAWLTGRPVEYAFNALIPLVGGLSTAVVYALSRCLHPSRAAALLSAFAYAFLAHWGSLDYFRWGGLPNATGMLFLCTIAWVVLRWMPGPGAAPAARRLWSLVGGLTFLAIYQTHHHSALVASIVLVLALVFATPELRGRTARVLLTGLLLALPVIVARYLSFLGLVGATNVLRFAEHPIPLWRAVAYLGPPFVALFCAALWATRRSRWSAEATYVLAWVTTLFLTFVTLEYGGLAESLIATGGERFTTAFSPSRFVTDMVYPMSVLCGAVTMWGAWQHRPRAAQAVLLACALGTCAYTWIEQRHVGATPELKDVGHWLRENTPANALVLGQEHYLAYYSWRENNFTPLPASEPRNAPDIVWKKEPHPPEVWRDWSREHGRPVFFVLPRGPVPPGLARVHTNAAFEIHELAEAP